MRYFLYLSRNTLNPSDQVKIIAAANDVADAVKRINSFLSQQDFGFNVTAAETTELTPLDGVLYYEDNGFLKLREFGAP